MPTKQQKVINLISAIRDSHGQMTNIFMNGSCLNLFYILRSAFPGAKAWYSPLHAHVLTEISGRFYDIMGDTQPDKTYQPITRVYSDIATTKRLIKRMEREEFDFNDAPFAGDFIIR